MYYVTFPSKIASSTDFSVSHETQSFAIKVMTKTPGRFSREVGHLRAIRQVWNLDRAFYYLGDSQESTSNLSLIKDDAQYPSNDGLKYNWFNFLHDKGSMVDPLIIVMHPAVRKSLRTDPTNEEAYSELLVSLQMAHKANVLHCDVRPSNCLYFPGADGCSGGWQVIDD